MYMHIIQKWIEITLPVTPTTLGLHTHCPVSLLQDSVPSLLHPQAIKKKINYLYQNGSMLIREQTLTSWNRSIKAIFASITFGSNHIRFANTMPIFLVARFSSIYTAITC